MVHVGRGLMTGIVVWTVVLSLVCQTTLGREMKLAIYPQRISVEASKFVLLPPAAVDGDEEDAVRYTITVKK